MSFRPLGLVVGLLAAAVASSASAQTVFHYSYDANTVLPTIVDQGPAGNDAAAGPLAVLSSDVATLGVPAGSGDMSFDSSDPNALLANQAGAATVNTLLLDNASIEAAGGFTFETWFKWNGGGSVNSILDYAGTDKLVIDQRDGESTTLAMRLDPNDLAIGEVTANDWHYVAFVFDSSGNSLVDDTITGQATAYLDGLSPIDLGEATKSAFGDSLNRSIGIGQHPVGFDLDYFDGSVYETRVSLGSLEASDLLFVPEPSSALLLAFGLLGLVCRRSK